MVNLRLHGDADVLGRGADLSVNVVTPTPPWLLEALRPHLARLDTYPDPSCATHTLARHLGVPPESVLLTAGGAEAFTLLARVRPWRRACVVHPQFTEPEAALAAVGHPVTRVMTRAEDDFTLHPRDVPGDADLVCVGNPTNPTSRLHPAADLMTCLAPGRILAVDEAFMDATDETQSLVPVAPTRPDVIVLRSLTKTYGIPGLRAGYIVAHPQLVDELRELQPPWSVGTLALAAVEATCSQQAEDHVHAWRAGLADRLADLVRRLEGARFHVVADPRAPFVLARRDDAATLRVGLRERGIAVRRGDTFPGLGPTWLRIAARTPEIHARLMSGIAEVEAARPRPADAEPPTPSSPVEEH